MGENKNYRWNADQYAIHSDSQYVWGMELIEKLQLKGHETLLDIGCGHGKLTASIARLLPKGHVVGIDSSLEMIALAQRRFCGDTHLSLEFKHLDARALDYHDRFEVIFSNAALHWVKHHPPMLLRIGKAMKSGGRLLFQMGGRGNAAWIIAVLDKLIEKKWRVYFSDFTFPYGFHGPKTYTRWLQDAGLRPMRAELIRKDMSHQGREGLAGWIQTTWLPYLERVPAHLRETLIEDIVGAYLANHPLHSDGSAHVPMVRLEVEAVKLDD